MDKDSSLIECFPFQICVIIQVILLGGRDGNPRHPDAVSLGSWSKPERERALLFASADQGDFWQVELQRPLNPRWINEGTGWQGRDPSQELVIRKLESEERGWGAGSGPRQARIRWRAVYWSMCVSSNTWISGCGDQGLAFCATLKWEQLAHLRDKFTLQ